MSATQSETDLMHPVNSPANTLPEYVERAHVGEISIRPPGVFTGAGVTVYAARGAREKMQRFAQRFFDEPTHGEVTSEVLGPVALFVFFNVDRLSSPAQPMGWTPNREFSLCFPLVLKFRDAPQRARLGLWAPYVVIDNARGMVTGRESWGWFKSYGVVDSPRHSKDGVESILQTMIFTSFDPNTEGKNEKLISVRSNAEATGVIEKIEHAVDDGEHLCREFLKLIAEGLDDSALFWDLVKMWKRHEIPAFNLKQFRAAEDASRACYQAITTCPLKVTNISSMHLLPANLEINITHCDSHRIVEQLGFPGQTFPTSASLFIEMDYEAENGEVLWQSNRISAI